MMSDFQHYPKCWPDVMTGDRITLKKMLPTYQNAKMLFDAVQDNIHHLKDSFDFLIHKIMTIDETLEYLKENHCETDLGRRDNYGIFVEDTFVGMICAWGDRHTEREVLYWLIEDACGHGFMNEALALVEREQAKSAPHKELFAFVNDKAISSATLLKKREYSFCGSSFWKMPALPQKPIIVVKHSAKIEQKKERIYG